MTRKGLGPSFRLLGMGPSFRWDDTESWDDTWDDMKIGA